MGMSEFCHLRANVLKGLSPGRKIAHQNRLIVFRPCLAELCPSLGLYWVIKMFYCCTDNWEEAGPQSEPCLQGGGNALPVSGPQVRKALCDIIGPFPNHQ